MTRSRDAFNPDRLDEINPSFQSDFSGDFQDFQDVQDWELTNSMRAEIRAQNVFGSTGVIIRDVANNSDAMALGLTGEGLDELDRDLDPLNN